VAGSFDRGLLRELFHILSAQQINPLRQKKIQHRQRVSNLAVHVDQ